MSHSDLICRLSAEVTPVGRHAVGRRILRSVLLGGILTLAAVGCGLGFRHDLLTAMHGMDFWIKWTYCGSLTVLALAATTALARPDSQRGAWLQIALIPLLGLGVLSSIELMHTPPNSWLAIWLGRSWKVCSALIFLLSVPIASGLVWSLRGLAPTRLHLAGASAGLAAGAFSATLYCLHCPETSALFVLTWYTLGIALPGVAGALLGPRLLRW